MLHFCAQKGNDDKVAAFNFLRELIQCKSMSTHISNEFKTPVGAQLLNYVDDILKSNESTYSLNAVFLKQYLFSIYRKLNCTCVALD